MRISHLLQREPFSEILSRTIERHWRARHGKDIRVQWGKGGTGQRWWGNSYLNFFAGADVPSSAFEVLRREYSHSRVRWRRPLQRGYVRLATTHPSLRWFSNVQFSVSPSLANTHDLLILGGNHRLRLLQPAGGRSTVVLKEQFGAKHIVREVELRTQLAPRCAPALLASNPAQGWFEEEYFAGTPINRLPSDEERAHQHAAVQAIWLDVVAPTLERVPIRGWANPLLMRMRETVGRCSAVGGQEILQLAEILVAHVEQLAGGSDIPVAWTHGDLQEANIVVNGSERRVIDWEGADRRFAAYDFFQLASGGRWTDGEWASRVARALNGEDSRLFSWLREMRALECAVTIPRWWGFAYVLEELWFRAEGSAEPAFHRPGADWPQIARQGAEAIAALKAGKS